jgi:hypothetical protein
MVASKPISHQIRADRQRAAALGGMIVRAIEALPKCAPHDIDDLSPRPMNSGENVVEASFRWFSPTLDQNPPDTFDEDFDYRQSNESQ